MNIPPKRRSSERMKSHMPNLAPVSSLTSSKTSSFASLIFFKLLKIVGTMTDDWDFSEVLGRGRGRNLPFERRSTPRIIRCFFTLEKGVEEIPKHDDQPGNKNPRTESRCQM